LGTGSVVGLTGFLLERKVEPLTPAEISMLNSKDVNSFDRSACNNYNSYLADISDICIYTLISAPALLFLSSDIRNDFGTVSAMYLETMAFMYALPSVLKGSVTRCRPFVYNSTAPLDKKLEADAVKSYFSGHTTVAFSSAVFISTVFSDFYPDSKFKNWVWGGSLVAAATIGYLRYAAGKHYPTDIIKGALVGSAIGYLIPAIHKVKKNEKINTPETTGKNEFSIGVSLQF
jgi:membrane-associated phospholipid phosphatase